MSRHSALTSIAALFSAAALLSACGSDDSPPPPPPPPPPAAATIGGTVAVGAALAGANVAVTDSSGASVCSEANIVTSGIGAYSCTLMAGKSAPFLIVVTDPTGAHAPLVSIGTTTPASGDSLVLNATPLTTAIVSQLAPDKSALSVVANPSLIDKTALASVTSKVLAQLADVLSALGAPAGYDPFSSVITASTASVSGNSADKIIDLLSFSVVNGVPTVGTIDNPAAGVPLADASSATATKLPLPSNSALGLADALKLLSASLQKCFALPAAQRVTSSDTSVPQNVGGPRVTGFAADCSDIVHADYLHNGYDRGQAFYGSLTNDAMTGAVFSLPEVLQFIADSTSAGSDRAIVNLRYLDKNGLAGNLISVARKIPSSTTTAHATDWWLYGNQQPVDTRIEAFVRRSEQLAPNPGTGVFAFAGTSRFESGLNVYINKDGPGSAGLRAARVKGPGLPPAGLVLTPLGSSICSNQTWMNIRRKDGNTGPSAATPSDASDGNIFRMQRTRGLSGTDATTVRPNPNAGNNDNTGYLDWAHPLDYGAALGATNYIDFSQLKAFSLYSIEMFYTGETAPRYTFNKTLLTPILPATTGGSLQWILLDAATRNALDPAKPQAAAAASLNLGWTTNTYSEPIRSAGVYTWSSAGNVNQGLVAVAKGATSAVATAPTVSGCNAGTQFPALTSDGSSGRIFQLRYGVLDGSYKDSFTLYN